MTLHEQMMKQAMCAADDLLGASLVTKATAVAKAVESHTVADERGRPAPHPVARMIEHLHLALCRHTDPEDVYAATWDVCETAAEYRDRCGDEAEGADEIAAANRADDVRKIAMGG